MRSEWKENFAGCCRQDGVSGHSLGKISISFSPETREMNIIAMRLGPGNHLQGRILMAGVVKPESFDYFYEVRL